MKFYGTRDKQKSYSLADAAIMGLSPCGGLFMPAHIPSVDLERVCFLAERSYAEMATYLSSLFFGEELSYEALKEVCCSAYDFEVPIHHFDDKIATLELFGGPTFAFKDFGARFMSRMLVRLFPSERVKIVTATSGDTGSAVAAGFLGNNADVYILYPADRVSDFQERQMTTLGENIRAIRVDGSFDDCQSMVKRLFADVDFSKTHKVTSANSISLLRWIPQSFYYFWLYAKTGRKPLDVIVPSGNYGNLSAALLAKKMGLPIGRLVAASNSNTIIPNYLKTGIYAPQESVRTISNAMDVGSPSNFERLFDLCGSYSALKEAVLGISFDDVATKDAIKAVYAKYNYVIDPHSALGYAATKAFGGGVFLSTAHSIKFKEVVDPVLGITTEYPERAACLFEKQKRFTELAVDVEALKRIVADQ